MSVDSFLKGFLKDRRGSTATIFALSLLPLVGMVGAAVDLQSAGTERQRMQDALDAATLAVMSRPDAHLLSLDQSNAVLQRVYASNGGPGRASFDAAPSTGTTGAFSATTSASYSKPTLIVGIMGIDSTALEVNAAASNRQVTTMTSMAFRLRYITGAYDKRISLFGYPDGSTTPVELMNIAYTWPVVGAGTTTTTRKLVNGTMVDVSRTSCPRHTDNLGCTTRTLSGNGTAEIDL